jgi:hypothetical protein
MRAARIVLFALAAIVLISGTAPAGSENNPLSFFEGITESVGTMNVLMHKPIVTKSVSRGNLGPDGSLSLLQRVEEQGKPAHFRRWLIRQLAPGHFSGSMSEASGPVTIDQEGGRFHFRFKMKGGLSVDQWFTPLEGGRSAMTDMTVRKFGFAVARSHGIVRKVS